MLVQISTVVIANIYVVCSCLDSSIYDVSECGYIIAENRNRLIVFIIVILLAISDLIAKL